MPHATCESPRTRAIPIVGAQKGQKKAQTCTLPSFQGSHCDEVPRMFKVSQFTRRRSQVRIHWPFQVLHLRLSLSNLIGSDFFAGSNSPGRPACNTCINVFPLFGCLTPLPQDSPQYSTQRKISSPSQRERRCPSSAFRSRNPIL